jgi:uncharacterized protein (DUF433 family)/predicted HTH domain antitoxin
MSTHTLTLTIPDSMYRQLTALAGPPTEVVLQILTHHLILSHPHIEIVPTDIASHPFIKGTDIGVELIVGCVQEGYTPEKIATAILPNLTLAQIYDALSYYEDHRDTVDCWLANEAPLPKKATIDEAIVLYLAGRCSLAKAADLTGLTRWDLQEIMYERGTPVEIYCPDTAEEMDARMEEMVHEGLLCSL